MATVGTHNIKTFPSPVLNGAGTVDANTVRTNDNITGAAFNAHDSDASIHVQSGTLAARPTTSAEGSVYVGTDTLLMYIYTGGSWSQVL
jgi:hypothetical protein